MFYFSAQLIKTVQYVVLHPQKSLV